MMVTLNSNMKGHMEVFQKILGKDHNTDTERGSADILS